MIARGLLVFGGSLVLAGCCPDDPRDHPARIFEFTGADVDRYRALAGLRTREEFIQLCVEQFKAELHEARQRDPDKYREMLVGLRDMERSSERGHP